MSHGPSPDERFPIPGIDRTAFLKPFITRPNIIMGDYTYYDDPRGPAQFEANVLYHFEFTGDRLIIGRGRESGQDPALPLRSGHHRPARDAALVGLGRCEGHPQRARDLWRRCPRARARGLTGGSRLRGDAQPFVHEHEAQRERQGLVGDHLLAGIRSGTADGIERSHDLPLVEKRHAGGG